MSQDNSVDAIRKHYKALRLFYTHLAVYLLVNIALTAINLATSSDKLWFYWAWLGWGIAIVFHALSVYGLKPHLGQNWEDRKIQEALDTQDPKP